MEEGIKIAVNCKEHSKIVQEHLFKLGGWWYGRGSNRPTYKSSPYLFMTKSGWMTRSVNSDQLYFMNHRYKEVTLKELINMVNK